MCQLLSGATATPWMVARQAPLSIELSRQEYWSGLPFPTPGVLPDPGIEHPSLTSFALESRFFAIEPHGKSHSSVALSKFDYTVEVRNRFKGLDLRDRVPEELWTGVRDIVQDTMIKAVPKKIKAKRQNGLYKEVI